MEPEMRVTDPNTLEPEELEEDPDVPVPARVTDPRGLKPKLLEPDELEVEPDVLKPEGLEPEVWDLNCRCSIW